MVVTFYLNPSNVISFDCKYLQLKLTLDADQQPWICPIMQKYYLQIANTFSILSLLISQRCVNGIFSLLTLSEFTGFS